MTPRILSIAVLLSALSLVGGVARADTYSDLVAKAEKGDATVDFTALRLSYPESATYDPYATQTKPLFSAAWNAVQAKDCTTAMGAAKAMLAINYLSVPMHAILQDCLAQSGDAAGATRERVIGRGIAMSLFASGDGKSPATAYVVVTLSEEGLVESYLGLKAEQQALIRDHDHVYDQISGHDSKTGEARGLYFDVGAIFVGLAKKMGKPSAAP